MVTGGILNSTITEIIDIETGEIVRCQDFPVEELNEASGTLYEGKPLICGGSNHEYVCHQLIEGEWIENTKMALKDSRSFSGSTIVPEIGFFITGGRNGGTSSEYLNSHGVWTDGPKMP